MTDEPRNPDRDSEQEINKRPDERTDQGERLTRPTDEEVPAPATGGKGAAGAGGPDGFGTGSE
jgi:hypothetical protein